jgi:hypothetical protein
MPLVKQTHEVVEVNCCLVCGAPAPMAWFCECCTQAKEEAYRISRELGETTHAAVIERRDRALALHAFTAHGLQHVYGLGKQESK